MSKQEKIHKQIDREVDEEFKKKIHDAIKMGLFNPTPLAVEDLTKLPLSLTKRKVSAITG